MADQQEA